MILNIHFFDVRFGEWLFWDILYRNIRGVFFFFLHSATIEVIKGVSAPGGKYNVTVSDDIADSIGIATYMSDRANNILKTEEWV